MSGQYAEQQKGDMEHMAAVPSQPSANTTSSGTPRTDEVLRIEDNWGAIRSAAGDVEDGVTPQEAHDEMVATLTALARKFERELIEAASALTTLTQQQKQHGDMALPLANGGASTTASGTPRTDALVDVLNPAQVAVALKRHAEMLEREIGEVLDALLSLIALKDHKDAVGKDEYYEREQPLAWQVARTVAIKAAMKRGGPITGK